MSIASSSLVVVEPTHIGVGWCGWRSWPSEHPHTVGPRSGGIHRVVGRHGST